MALGDVPHGLFGIMKPVIILSSSLNGFSPPPDCGVDLLLDGSLMPRHLPLLAGWEIAGIWLGKSRRELERSCTCSSKQLILLLNEGYSHVADSDGKILRNARKLDAPYTFETSSSPHFLPLKAGAFEAAVTTPLAPRTIRKPVAGVDGTHGTVERAATALIRL